MPQFIGRAELRIAGVLYPTGEGAVLNNPQGMSRQPATGAQNYGYTEKAEPITIEASFFMNGDITLADLWAVTDQTVTFECDDGSIFACGNTSMAEISKLTAGTNAQLAIKLIAQSCDQQ